MHFRPMPFGIGFQLGLVGADGVAAHLDAAGAFLGLAVLSFHRLQVDVDHAQRDGIGVESGGPEELDLVGVSLDRFAHEQFLDLRLDAHFEEGNIVGFLVFQGCLETLIVCLAVALGSQGSLYRGRKCHETLPCRHLQNV